MGIEVKSDVFSLGVLTRQLLTGHLPYDVRIPQAKSRAAQRKLAYTPAREHDAGIPVWVDDALRKAERIAPHARYEDAAEFVFDLHHLNRAFRQRTRAPLIERSPVAFWQGVAFALLLVLMFDLALRR